jgi:hypothetical protein
VNLVDESAASKEARAILNFAGSPTNTIAAGYQWSPGTELSRGLNSPVQRI